ncbi:helix-turn-helix domain-containing protein [Vibrio cholerae]
MPWPKGERIIAEAIGMTPQEVWPSRYRSLRAAS